MGHSSDSVVAWLRENGSDEVRAGMLRYAIPNERAFGLAMRDMKSYARKIGKDHDLALALWESGWYEARTVAVFIAEPAAMTSAQMDTWAADFDSWAICDTACFHLFDRTRHAWSKVPRWAKARSEFKKRAAFALLWGLSIHDKEADDERFLDALEWIEHGARDDRLYVKKSVDMALRAIGKRTRPLNDAACDIAARLAAEPDRAPSWIGRHALRELESERVQARLGGERPEESP